MKTKIDSIIVKNFLYMMVFATIFLLFYVTTNLSGLNIDQYKDLIYDERMIYINGVMDGLRTAEIISSDHISGRKIWKPVFLFRVYYNLKDYESIAIIVASNLWHGDHELEYDMPIRIAKEVRRIYGGK